MKNKKNPMKFYMHLTPVLRSSLKCINSLVWGLLASGCSGLFDDFEFEQSKKINVNCGGNSGKVRFLLTKPNGKQANKTALLLSPSPGTLYFSASSGTGGFALKQTLLHKGVHTLEVKYKVTPRTIDAKVIPDNVLNALSEFIDTAAPQKKAKGRTIRKATGYYALCYQKGTAAGADHNAQLYDEIMKFLGEQKAPTQTLLGAGFSLGAIQLSSMIFMSNKKVMRAAFTGILGGNVKKGYGEARKITADGTASAAQVRGEDGTPDGTRWPPSLSLLAGLLEPSLDYNAYTDGSADFKPDFVSNPSALNRYWDRQDTVLGLFEGGDTGGVAGGLPGQARFIHDARIAAGRSTDELKIYGGLGSGCAHGAVADPSVCGEATSIGMEMAEFLLK